ncbi:MAG: hypothetical protein JWP27_2490 [Flaviaesturariibacter sp.]|nr:hypothetical protein [Flaviaesturariibacter sp.]
MRSFLLLCLATSLSATAQTSIKTFHWQERPALHAVADKYKDEAAVYVQEDKINEYSLEKDGIFLYKTVHRLIHINTDKGIEYFNRIYLPFDQALQMVTVKARTTLPSGKVIELDEKNIKDLQEDNRTYKIFALEGLAKGCEVEFYYTMKQYASFFGREYMTARVPVMASHFELISPDHLKFDARTYNNLPAFRDTSYGEKRYLSLDAANLDAPVEETYSMQDANLKRVEYKLSYNVAKSTSERLFTWNELAKKVYDNYSDASEKETKRVRDLVSDAGILSASSETEKITRLENYLKKNFQTRTDIDNEDAGDLVKVIKTKVSSERAFNKLFATALAVSNIDFEIVLSGDRSDFVIEKNIENWNNAQNLLFYFPSQQKYLAPSANAYRYPWIPPTWAGTNGLYCVVTKLGTFQSAIGEIKPITMEDMKYSFHNLELRAELDKDMDALLLDVKQIYGGYTAATYRAPFVFYPADEQDKILRQLVKYGSGKDNLLSSSFENKELEQADPYKPFIIKAKLKAPELVEKAGEKIIIKVGDLIGEQVQMYDEKERTTPIELPFPHVLDRTIDIVIPDGYEIKNLKDLAFNEVVTSNGKVTMGFVSTYSLDKNILHIVISESYNKYYYPMEQYPAFKKVINASADFNKVVLVLDRKK